MKLEVCENLVIVDDDCYRSSMQTRSGLRLDSDIFLPHLIQPGQTFPVLLMRQPYGRAIASTVVYAHPRWYASQGYIVVIQDVRGRGTSEGEFALFETEIADGYDAVMWAANLPHSNGLVGMYGFSYQGMTQLYAAAQRPEPLKTICPAMLAYDLRSDWAYENGVFCLQANLGWAIQLAAETARRSGDGQTFQALKLAANSLPLQGENPAYPELLKTLAPDSFYHDWITRSAEDAYWQRLSPKSWIDAIADLPMLHIGGWFDPYLRGTLGLYEAMVEKSKAPQALIIGPWAHLPWGRTAGGLDYGAAAVSNCDRSQIQWFDYWLKGEGSLNAKATWFEMGSNRWVTSATWVQGDPMQWKLKITGLTSIQGSTLVRCCDQNPSNLLQSDETSQLDQKRPIVDALVHDPWRPVPSVGGHASSPAGPIDRRYIDDRSDVLTYTTEKFTNPILIQGISTIDLDFLSDPESIDFHVVLSQVQPTGSVFPIAQGVNSIDLNSCRQSNSFSIQSHNRINIPLQATSTMIPIGSALRVSISLSCFPAFPVNPGTGTQVSETKAIEAQVITILLCGGVLSIPIASHF